MSKKIKTFLLILAFLSACAPGGQILQPASTATPPGNMEPTAASSTPIGNSIPIIIYTQSGGITGQTRQWTIFADGRLETGKGDVYHISVDEIKTLQKKLHANDFIQTAKIVKTPGTCADCILMSVTLFEDGQSYELRTNLVDNGTSEKERGIIEALDTMIRKAGGQ